MRAARQKASDWLVAVLDAEVIETNETTCDHKQKNTTNFVRLFSTVVVFVSASTLYSATIVEFNTRKVQINFLLLAERIIPIKRKRRSRTRDSTQGRTALRVRPLAVNITIVIAITMCQCWRCLQTLSSDESDSFPGIPLRARVRISIWRLFTCFCFLCKILFTVLVQLLAP